MSTVELHHDIQGEGPPLLLIAGLGLSSGAWATVAPALAQSYTVITVDNRGTGRSPVPEGPYTIDGMADDIAALLRSLDLGPVSAVGWSLGGSLLQSLLINHGELIDKAVLLNAFPSYTKVQDAWLDAGLILRQSGLEPAALAVQGLAWALTPRALTNHEALYETQRMAAEMDPHPTSYEGYAGQAAGLRVYDSREQLPTVTNKVLVLAGAEDTLTPPWQSVEMAELIPNAHLQILPRGNHGMILEYPDDTLAAITAFLSRPA
ncbi:alpha/beta fold hydrolase [Ornithinimicrobium sufpigmenti]|uniref:alpha/beta fold hydrolase n=1 Tax=Ornithinimicrobium sufpigmenti TaxID=2508882 RepID=UPI0010368CCB|nr:MULTISPECIES: alpha/beta fold hydrolase [unclassified Ornithinimicrobium]